MTTPGIQDGSPSPTDATRMIMVIRHAEKPLHPAGSPYGVTPHGEEDPHSLTVTGWTRAGALAQLFAPAHGRPPLGLRRPRLHLRLCARRRAQQTLDPDRRPAGRPPGPGDRQTLRRGRRGPPGQGGRRPGRRHPHRLAPRGHPQHLPPPGHRRSVRRPITGLPTGSTSSGPSPSRGTGGGSPRFRNSSCPATCPTRSLLVWTRRGDRSSSCDAQGECRHGEGEERHREGDVVEDAGAHVRAQRSEEEQHQPDGGGDAERSDPEKSDQ